MTESSTINIFLIIKTSFKERILFASHSHTHITAYQKNVNLFYLYFLKILPRFSFFNYNPIASRILGGFAFFKSISAVFVYLFKVDNPG